MPFMVQGCIDNHTLAVTADAANEVFAKAIEWHLVGRFSGVSIYDGARMYSIDERGACECVARECVARPPAIEFACVMRFRRLPKQSTPLLRRRRAMALGLTGGLH